MRPSEKACGYVEMLFEKDGNHGRQLFFRLQI